MRTRLVILLAVLAMFCSACVRDGKSTTTAGATTTSVGSTTTMPVTTTAVGEEIDASGFPIPPGTTCFYLNGYVAVPADQAAAAEALLGHPPTDASTVLEATSQSDELPPDNSAEIDTLLATSIRFFGTSQDPLQVSMALLDQGVTASPINLLGFTVHIKFQPGTDPSFVPDFELPDVSGTPLDGGLVAVVDSGIVPPDLEFKVPNWFYGMDDASNRFVLYDPMDEEILGTTDLASHGTFVSGLIRQIAPATQVTFAAARLVDTGEGRIVSQGDTELPAGFAPTSEIQVAEAIARLMLRHPNDAETMKALNLSLGSYVCDPAADADLVTIAAVSNLWLTQFPGSRIMAAAGNENYQGPVGAAAGNYIPFYPAGLSVSHPGISGVAAVDRAGVEIVWVNKEPVPVGAAGRPWVTESAPGADLVNLSGAIDRNGSGAVIPSLVCWSGSSFATAVASAQLALGVTPASKDYNQVDGLTFVEADGSEVVTVGGQSATPSGVCDHNAED